MSGSKPIVVEKLVSRTCGWCGVEMPYSGKGRPPSFCCKAHRNRAWEVRTAAARQAAARNVGAAVAGPVREVVERTTVIEKPVVVPGPSVAPVLAGDWIALLDQLAAQLRGGKVGREHWHHRKLFRALTDVYMALDNAHPGSLENLTARR